MPKSISKQTLGTSEDSSLDATIEDFQNDGPIFRVPAKSQKSQVKRKRGRPKLALQKTSVHNKNSGNCEKKENLFLPLDSEPVNDTNEDDDIVFLKIEKSLSSDYEKLCPSCKLIVPKKGFADHFSECLQNFKFSKSSSTDHEGGTSFKEFPCPICLKKISHGTRSSHIKSCGQSHGLTSEKILLASRLQEKQAEERSSLGLPLSENKPAADTRGEPHCKISSRPGKSKLNSELDLALALSNSLVEEEAQKRRLEEDQLLKLGLANVVLEERRERPYLLPQPVTSKNSLKRKRPKKQRERETPLMVRSSQERERIVSEKVASLLASNNDTTKQAQELQRPKLNAALNLYVDQESSLWTTAGANGCPMEEYYVPQLQDYIQCQNVAVGGLLKHLSQVPGRLNCTNIDQDSDNEEESDLDSNNIETTVVDSYCTQLALAELLSTQEVDDLTFSNLNNTLEEISEPDYGKLEATNGFWIDSHDTSTGAKDMSESSCSGLDSRVVSKNHPITNSFLIPEMIGDKTEDFKSCCPKTENSLDKKSISCLLNKESFAVLPEAEATDKCSPKSESNSLLCENTLKIVGNDSEISPKKSTEIAILTESLLSPSISLTPKTSHTRSPFNKLQVDELSSRQSQNQECLKSKLTYDWSVILANSAKSDLLLETVDESIRLHKLVLFVRCRLLYKEAEKGDWKISWKNVSFEAAYLFIIYLYTGQCSIESKENLSWMSVFELALKYNCEELVEYLEALYKCSSSPLKPDKGFSQSSPLPTSSKSIDFANDQTRLSINQIESNSPDIFNDCDSESVCSIISPSHSPLPQILPSTPSEELSPLKLSATPKEIGPQERDFASSPQELPIPMDQVDTMESNLSSQSISKVEGSLSRQQPLSKFDTSNRMPSSPSRFDRSNSVSNELVDLAEESDDSDSNAIDLTPPNHYQVLSRSPGSPAFKESHLDQKTPDKDVNQLKPVSDDGFISDVWDGFENACLDTIISSPLLEENCQGRSSSGFLKESLPVPKETTLEKEKEVEASSYAQHGGDQDSAFLHCSIGDETMMRAAAQAEEMLPKGESSAASKTPLSKPAPNPQPLTPCLVTPQPNYKAMVTPELKKELEKFGIRQMSKSKAIKLLLHIYDQMHPLVDDEANRSSSSITPRPVGKKRKKKLPIPKPPSTDPSEGLRGRGQLEDLDEEGALDSSQSSSFDCLEEALFGLEDKEGEGEDGTATQEDSLKQQIKNFILSNHEWHRRVLLYEPLLVPDLHHFLKAYGIKCSQKKLIAFLDEQCITFRFKPFGDSRTKKRKRKSSINSKKRRRKLL